MILLIISFIAGILTVIAPCVLPMLPVIVGGSLSNGKVEHRRVFVVLLSLSVSIIVFTLLLKASTILIEIPPYIWSWVSGALICFLGITYISPGTWKNGFLAKFQTKSNILLGKGDAKKSTLGDVLVGASLGPVFTSCSPTFFFVLGSVLPTSFGTGVLYLLSFTLGLSIGLLLIVYVGGKILNFFGVLSESMKFRRVLGIFFVLVGVSIFFGIDKKVETSILQSGFIYSIMIENSLLEQLR
ncbi:MAG: cytochrome C biogenesis protein [Candidatus Taylorbacteria bacterium]|nr:cytochrome C biogenesis protein [Candidatus Taylorbacteria bacterium]